MNIPDNEKVKVKKDNRVLILSGSEAETYLQMGYTVHSLTGEKIATPETYKSRLEEAQEEIKRLTAELETVRRENDILSSKLKASGNSYTINQKAPNRRFKCFDGEIHAKRI